MNQVKLQWATPDIDKQIMFQARVSNPKGQNSENARLLSYCMEEGHVSVFEMASACMEINTTRDIARQILRHRSASFQEFSQRYSDASALGDMVEREVRLQDAKNRQNSIETDSGSHKDLWSSDQRSVWDMATTNYKYALQRGVAKEVARALLPEGLTPSRLYMSANIRTWVHYLKARLHESTQKEHRIIAQQALVILRGVAPITMDAFFGEKS